MQDTSARWISNMEQLYVSVGWTSWTDQFSLLEALASSHRPFSLYIVSASESDEGLVPLFRGSGGQVKFLIEKKHVEEYWYQRGKKLGRLAFYTWQPGNILKFKNYLALSF